VPEGFCVREFTTTPVMETRVMRFAPNGDLFVAAPSAGTPGGARGGPGAIVVLADDDHDGKADSVVTYAGATGADTGCARSEADPADLSCVHGIAFTQNYVYYTRSEEVRRFPYKSGDRNAQVPAGELVARIEGASMGARWTHGLEIRQDGRVLVSRGRFESSGCDAKDMGIGAVFSLDVTAPLPVTPAVVADGFRNPMYLRCRPGCGDCFANELSGDGWGGIGGHEKLVTLAEGSHWGYPCCVAKDIPAAGGNIAMCSSLAVEPISVPLHDTPFGLDFETGKFGAPYTYAAFAALHGSVAGWTGTAISWAPTDPATHAPTGKFQVFASGWGTDGKVRGRATELTFAPDGRLFVGDDMSGRIFWIAPRTLARP
jgi:glucose/arabinose dehydrogenase